MSSLLLAVFLFLLAGVAAVPIAARFGLGSVLGYLVAGIVISPVLYALHIDVEAIQHIAEFGVVMMLFIVGLELEPRRLWKMRQRLFGLGGLQVILTTALIAGAAMMAGIAWTVSVAIGLVLCLSSTAIVLQTLNEKSLLKSDGGQAAFSVLLFQDIAVIAMLALIPLLSMPELMDAASQASGVQSGHSNGGEGTPYSLVENVNVWQRTLITLSAIAAVIFGGHFLVRPLFRYIAMANLREIFVAAALLLVVGIALLMTAVGLSPALGTFLAGVVLANSEFRHELESDIDPFKGLLLGLFFITVGAAIDFTLLVDNFLLVIGLTLGLLCLKAFVLFLSSIVFAVRGSSRWLFSLGLAQAGEFGFVLLSFSVVNNVIPETIADKLLLVVTFSMLLTPLLFMFHEKYIAPGFNTSTDTNTADVIEERADIIVAGIGRFGSVINRILTSSGYRTVVVDYNAKHLETFRALGIKAFYGDASRPDLLHAAGIEHAKILVVAIDGEDQITTLVRYVREHHPGVHIVARAVNRHHVYALYAAGEGDIDIIRDTFDSATRAARSVLEAVGMEQHDAQLKVDQFVEFDRFVLREVAGVYKAGVAVRDNPEYVRKVRALMPLENDILQGRRSIADVLERKQSGFDDDTDGT